MGREAWEKEKEKGRQSNRNKGQILEHSGWVRPGATGPWDSYGRWWIERSSDWYWGVYFVHPTSNVDEVPTDGTVADESMTLSEASCADEMAP